MFCRKINLVLIVMLSCCAIIFAGGKNEMVQNDEAVVISGRDFYFANLAYKDYSSRSSGHIFRQDKERVDDYINYLKELKEKYDIPMPMEEVSKMPRNERYDYFVLETFESVSEEDFRNRSFKDLNDFKFEITYGKESVKVYMYIDRPSVRGGDAEYIFDYDGNIISKKYGK